MSTQRPWVIVGSLLVLGLTGCGSQGASSARPSPTSTPAALPRAGTAFASDFVSDVNAVDAAAATFYKQLDAFAGHPSQTGIEQDAAPYATALTTLDNLLSNYTFLPNVEADVRLLVKADEADVSDIADISSYTSFRTWETTFVQDDKSAASADGVVDVDFGLPASF